jgi:hypothetical protein
MQSPDGLTSRAIRTARRSFPSPDADIETQVLSGKAMGLGFSRQVQPGAVRAHDVFDERSYTRGRSSLWRRANDGTFGRPALFAHWRFVALGGRTSGAV